MSVGELFRTALLREPMDISARHWPGMEVLDLRLAKTITSVFKSY
jgi:hypothetical protein